MNISQSLVLQMLSHYNGSNVPSIWSRMMDEEKTRPGYWLVSALYFFHCFDTCCFGDYCTWRPSALTTRPHGQVLVGVQLQTICRNHRWTAAKQWTSLSIVVVVVHGDEQLHVIRKPTRKKTCATYPTRFSSETSGGKNEQRTGWPRGPIYKKSYDKFRKNLG